MNQPKNKVTKQPTIQPTDSPTNQSTIQPSTNWLTKKPSTHQLTSQLTNEPTDWPKNRPTIQPTNQSTCRPTKISQPAKQLGNLSIFNMQYTNFQQGDIYLLFCYPSPCKQSRKHWLNQQQGMNIENFLENVYNMLAKHAENVQNSG